MSTKQIVKELGIKRNIDKDGCPKYWPILEAGDIGKTNVTYNDGSPCCSMGWLDWLTKDLRGHVISLDTWSELSEHLFKNLSKITGFTNISLPRLSDKATPKQRTQAWNMTGEQLGYNVIE